MDRRMKQGQQQVQYEPEGGIRNPACTVQDDDHCHGVSVGDIGSISSSVAGHGRQQQKQQQQPDDKEKKAQAGYVTNGHQEFRTAMTLCYARTPWRFAPNLIVCAVVSTLMLLSLLGVVPNQTIGFYCDDPKISHKFTGDTISMGLLLGITVLLPLIVIWTVEWMYYNPESYKSLEGSSSSLEGSNSADSSSASSSSQTSATRSRQFWKWYGYYTLGWYYLIFVVEALKMVVGEPRPHFLDSCRPREMKNCSEGTYQQSYTCTNTQLSWFYVNDSDKSFPSGHAALGIFTGTFLAWYLHSRMPNRLVLALIKPWLQCSAVLWGLACGLTRVTDHRHHWWDVGIGYGLGIFFAVFVVRVFCKGFRARNYSSSRGLSAIMRPASNGVIVTSVGATNDYNQKRIGASKGHANHQSIKKLLSTSSSIGEDPQWTSA